MELTKAEGCGQPLAVTCWHVTGNCGRARHCPQRPRACWGILSCRPSCPSVSVRTYVVQRCRQQAGVECRAAGVEAAAVSGPDQSPALVFPREANPWHICLETGTLPPRCPLHFCRLWPVSAVISTRRGWCREDHAGPRALCHLVTCRWECGGWAHLCAGAASGGWGEGQGRSGARAGCTRAWRVSPGQRSLCRVCVPGPGPGAVLQVGWSHLVYATLLDLTSGCSGLSGMNAFSAV